MKIRQEVRWLAPTPVITTKNKAAIPKRKPRKEVLNNANAAVTNRFERRPSL